MATTTTTTAAAMLNVDTLVSLGRLAEIAPSPCGTWLAAAIARLEDEGSRYVHDLWKIPADGSPATKLTSGPWNDRAPRFRPDGALLFLSNRPIGKSPEEGEDQRAQVWALPSLGEPTRVTDEPLGVSEFRIAGDVLVVKTDVWPGVVHDKQREHAKERGKRGPSGLRYTSMTVRFWDHWIPSAAPHFVVIDAQGRRDLTPSADREYRETDWDLSPDGRWIATARAFLEDDQIHADTLRVIEVATGHVRELGPQARVSVHAPRFDASSSRIAISRELRVSDDALPRRNLVVIDLDGNEHVRAADYDRWPVPALWDGDDVICTVDEAGRTDVVRIGANEIASLTNARTHANVVKLGDRFAAIRSGATEAPRAVLVGVADVLGGAGSKELADPSGFDPSVTRGVRIEELQVPTADGKSVHTLVLFPEGEGPFPTLLWIHGGPISHFGDVWHWRWNPLVMLEAGFAVALPNARGSTGYGHDWAAEVWADWGGRCFDDLMRVTDALEARKDVGKIAAMGGSFGGYMTAWIGGNTERFAALVDHAGLYDLRAFKGVTDFPGFFAAMIGGDLERWSPHRFVDRWKTPTLVIHGDKDYRVPVGEALSLFEALQTRGVPSELLLFPDENHWILKPRNVRQWYEAVLEFLGRHLR
ncbi:MAG: S9 family peptidase [Myxococcota bacterium]|nr:S9 family peptidase [Myxococcota bacterium]